MTIVLTGGGSGGHITPILAVAAEIKRRQPKTRVIYVGQRGDGLGDIPAQDPNIDEVYTVFAGKLRRYHGEGWKQLLDLPTMFKNLRDALYVVIGLYQSWQLMGKLRPDVIFSRGGFVSVPVCLGGALHHIPYMTHDSDPIPSLANRIIARWARVHAVALPTNIYPYPQAKTVTTGIPLNAKFVPVTATLERKYRQEIDVPAKAKLLFVIGGGLGSQLINRAMAEAVPHLLHEFPDLYVVHVVGRINQAEMEARYLKDLTAAQQQRLRVFDFIHDVYRYSGAADLIIARAGATNLAEFAVQGRACVIIPSAVLTGGHQLENARYLAEQHAAVVMDETELAADPNRLAKQVSALMKDSQQRDELGHKLHEFAQPHAAQRITDVLFDQITPQTAPKDA
ncbi:MAG TPA: UDP-N-acetylglucosamine--N-acetylmuramyl-(pentapeptide) pyrophosphoryl-undecaprenol N-acetylglucosamine transferase [Candidatus Saccharimonadales bacterium]|nr:UDP-N-acetylglucosamine--N-acetylmuramyl-(pentapeptide) pyrophosphoryl-undecaprenol N-acetylglucosamine transferase [Candidatus Saccharimonadales bacterium]